MTIKEHLAHESRAEAVACAKSIWNDIQAADQAVSSLMGVRSDVEDRIRVLERSTSQIKYRAVNELHGEVHHLNATVGTIQEQAENDRDSYDELVALFALTHDELNLPVAP